jgi:glycine/D-amino acid oxidase-like deaminating enzyme
VDPTPQQLRFSSYFLPMFAKRWQMLSPGDLQGWQYGHETRRKWALDRPTPMERVRILDPRPSDAILKETLARARRLLPALGSVPIQAGWAGYIDSTPDGVPVIDEAQNLPGFILAAGFSGHGFGIGPGAGRLIAELASGTRPFVDHTQYSLARLNRGVWGKVSEF